MKIKDILEDNVVSLDKFRNKQVRKPTVDNLDSLGPRGTLSRDAPEHLDNELERKRYEKFLNNQSGNVINDNNLVPYLRTLISDKRELSGFVRSLLTNNTHLYTLITDINRMLERANADIRLVGVSPNAEDWYFK